MFLGINWLSIYHTLEIIAGIISLLLLLAYVYFFLKNKELSEKREERWNNHFMAHQHEEPIQDEDEFLSEWNSIRDLFLSPSENDWRIGILRADALLEECIDTRFQFPPGLSFGEKLKGISRDQYPLIDRIWEVHKMRNNIAHHQNFHFNQKKALESMKTFDSIFRSMSCFR